MRAFALWPVVDSYGLLYLTVPVFWWLVFCVFVFFVVCLALSGGVCVFWPLLEELYLVETVTHCVIALKHDP